MGHFDLGALILRLSFGGLMLFSHGWPKLAKFSELSGKFPDPIGMGSQVALSLAVGAEVFAALLLILGLFTRLATIPLIITMIVAAFIIHGADPFQKKEMAILFLSAYVALLFMGSGKYSLQNMLKINSNSKFPFLAWLLK